MVGQKLAFSPCQHLTRNPACFGPGSWGLGLKHSNAQTHGAGPTFALPLFLRNPTGGSNRGLQYKQRKGFVLGRSCATRKIPKGVAMWAKVGYCCKQQSAQARHR